MLCMSILIICHWVSKGVFIIANTHTHTHCWFQAALLDSLFGIKSVCMCDIWLPTCPQSVEEAQTGDQEQIWTKNPHQTLSVWAQRHMWSWICTFFISRAREKTASKLVKRVKVRNEGGAGEVGTNRIKSIGKRWKRDGGSRRWRALRTQTCAGKTNGGADPLLALRGWEKMEG